MLQGICQTRANAPGATTSIPPVCLPSTKDSFMACRHHAMNSSDLGSGISLPQVSVMSTMQTQALYAVLRDSTDNPLRESAKSKSSSTE